MSDDEWAFVAPYLTLMSEDAPQREHPLQEVFNGLRYIVRRGGQPALLGRPGWRFMPNDLPHWYTVYQQTQRWVKAGRAASDGSSVSPQRGSKYGHR